jgi:hypothetical protein
LCRRLGSEQLVNNRILRGVVGSVVSRRPQNGYCMANRRTTFDKLQRERAKKAKAAAKRERRMDRSEPETAGDAADAILADDGQKLSATQLLEMVELIHGQLNAGEIGMEEFEAKKAELLASLPID